MLPHLQIDRDDNSIYISEANELISLKLNDITSYVPTKLQDQKLNLTNLISLRYKKSAANKNEIKINSKHKIFSNNEDISGFVKKENMFIHFNK